MRLLISISLLFVFHSIQGQISKETWLANGSASYSSTKYNSAAGSKNVDFELQLSPAIGYFLFDKLAIGIKAPISKIGVKGQGTDKFTTYTDFNLGPFIRYYLLPDNKPVNVLIECGYEYGYIKGDNDVVKKNTYLFSAGSVFFLTESLGIELLIGYSTFKFNEFKGLNNSIQCGIGLSIQLAK
jgi:hypothetical protein